MSDDTAEHMAAGWKDMRPMPDAALFKRPATLAHEALLYRSDEDFLAGTVPFLRAAVDRDERALAVTTRERVALITDALDGHASGVEFADAVEWYRVPAWTLGAYHQYVRRHSAGDRQVWVVGEPVFAGRQAEQVLEWHRYESIINVAFAGMPAHIVCPYDERALDPAIVERARETHPALSNSGGAVQSSAYLAPAEYTARHRSPTAPPPEMVLALAFDVRELSAVRRTAVDWARGEGLSEDRIRELLIAVHEVVSNAVEHGGGSGTVRFWSTLGELVCEVLSANPIDHPFPGYLPPDTRQERGRGLWMARQICTRVDVETGPRGALVRLTFARA